MKHAFIVVVGLVVSALTLTEVAHAQWEPGPMAVAPTAPIEVSAPDAGRTTLHRLVLEGPRNRWTGQRADVFAPLCTAPCTATLPLGTYYLGVSVDASEVRRYPLPIDVRGPLSLDVRMEDRDGLRTAGWVAFGAGAILAAALAVAMTAVLVSENGSSDLFYGLAFASLGSVVLGGLIALPLVAFNDAVTIRAR